MPAMDVATPPASKDAAAQAATLLRELGIPHQINFPLASATWYKVGGAAAALATPTSIEQLAALLQHTSRQAIPTFILGSGANLLVRDEGVPGIVIQLSDPCFKTLTQKGDSLVVGAGYDLAKLVLDAAKLGLAGLECLAGIPASVGGAVRMNAGGAFGDISQSVHRVRVMSIKGFVHNLTAVEAGFSYRRTRIVEPVVLEVELRLTPGDPEALRERVKEIMAYKKRTQPMAENSAGCAFKNPVIPQDSSAPANASAGRLIDLAGLKGFRIGGAEVSPVHANFVTTQQGATASDVLAVMQHAEQIVLEKFGVRLEREVVVWPA